MIFLACLSPETIQASVHITHLSAAFVIGIVIAGLALSLQQRRFPWVPFYVLLLATHPAWTMEAGGDCGYVARCFSMLPSGLCAGILLCQILAPNLNRRRLVNVLCLISWAGYLFFWLQSVFGIPSPSADGIIGQSVEGLYLGVTVWSNIALLPWRLFPTSKLLCG
jgi:hypothetical protein